MARRKREPVAPPEPGSVEEAVAEAKTDPIPATEMVAFINPDHIQNILNRTFAVVMRDAVANVVFEQSGWGKAADFRDVVRAEAARIVREDPEINAKIRAGVLSWVRRSLREQADGLE